MNASQRSDSASSWEATSKPTACQRSWNASYARSQGITSPARLTDQPKMLLIPELLVKARQHSLRADEGLVLRVITAEGSLRVIAGCCGVSPD